LTFIYKYNTEFQSLNNRKIVIKNVDSHSTNIIFYIKW